MIPLSPLLLIGTANAFVGLGPERFGDGLPALFRREVGVVEPTARAWDAAFVHHVGYWSHFDARSGVSSWPLPLSAEVGDIAQFAADRGVVRDDPRVGDLFLLHSLVRETFTRVGIVVAAGEAGVEADGVRYRECVTIEGDSARDLSGTGGLVLRHTRKLSPTRGDCFVRWHAAETVRGAA